MYNKKVDAGDGGRSAAGMQMKRRRKSGVLYIATCRIATARHVVKRLDTPH